MLTFDLDIKHPNRNIKHLNLLWSTRIDGISPERGDQIINDAKNDNLNDPPGFPGKILKVGDFARAMTSFWSKKAPKLIQYQIFLSEMCFYAVEVVSNHQNMNCGSNKQLQCWTFPARTKSSALKHRVALAKERRPGGLRGAEDTYVENEI